MSDVHISLGLLHEDVPRCRYHGCKLKPRVEPGPREVTTGQLLQKPTRVVWRCPKRNCHWVHCGEHSRIPLTQNSSGGNGLALL
jgi:hypothetical protein